MITTLSVYVRVYYTSRVSSGVVLSDISGFRENYGLDAKHVGRLSPENELRH